MYAYENLFNRGFVVTCVKKLLPANIIANIMGMSDTTILTKVHDAEAAMGEIDGCQVPLYYSSAEQEIQNVREKCGVFDLSHLTRIRLRGFDSVSLLGQFTSADVLRQEDNTAIPITLCDIECTLVRLMDFWVIVAPHDAEAALLEALKAAATGDARVDSQSKKVVQIAVCGPEASGILDKALPVKVADLQNGHAKFGTLMFAHYIAYRQDIAGFWTLHVMVPNMFAGKAWKYITQKAGENAIIPAGTQAWLELNSK